MINEASTVTSPPATSGPKRSIELSLDEATHHTKMYSCYIKTALKLSEMRYKHNASMLYLNGAIFSVYLYLLKEKVAPATANNFVSLLAYFSIAINVAWATTLWRFRSIAAAKYEVLIEVERALNLELHKRERDFYERDGLNPSLINAEYLLPVAFIIAACILAFNSL